jgi:hypothetical protein
LGFVLAMVVFFGLVLFASLLMANAISEMARMLS